MNDNGWHLNVGFTQLMETSTELKMAIFRKRALILDGRRSFGEGESLGEGCVSHEDGTKWLMSEAALVPAVKCPLAVY